MTTATREAEQLLKESLSELESAKGSVLTGLQRLVRAARLLGDENVVIWCEIQFGTSKYTDPLEEKCKLVNEAIEAGLENKENLTRENKLRRLNFAKQLKQNYEKLDRVGLKLGANYTAEELLAKVDKAGGGFQNIGSVEEIYANLVKLKQGNDGTYYRDPLSKQIQYVRRVGHDKANRLITAWFFRIRRRRA